MLPTTKISTSNPPQSSREPSVVEDLLPNLNFLHFQDKIKKAQDIVNRWSSLDKPTIPQPQPLPKIEQQQLF